MLDLDAIEKQCRADWGLHASDALPVIAECRRAYLHLGAQIERLASYILANVPGEPHQRDVACDTAIRIMTRLQMAAQPPADTLPNAVDLGAKGGDIGNARFVAHPDNTPPNATPYDLTLHPDPVIRAQALAKAEARDE